ncbi:MAG: O-antigen translocase [Ferruginibacter sp.]
MNLLKTSLFTSISTGISFICGLISIKIVATKIGPEGISLMGQYQNVVSLFSIVATLSISVGLIKYLSERYQDKEYVNQLLNTAFITVFIGSVIAGLVSIIFSTRLSLSTFHSKDLRVVFILFGFLLILASLNVIFSSIFNGLRQIKNLTIVTISTSIINLLLTVFLVNIFGLTGVLLASNFAAIFIFIINIFMLKKHLKGIYKFSFSGFNLGIFKKLLSYSAMSAVTLMLVPFNQFFIRDYLINNLGIVKAGYWQSVLKISDYYLLFVTSAFSVYFLPVFSGTIDRLALKKEIFNGYKIILPAVFIMSISIFFSRHLIIKILFTPEFAPMENLFLFQFLGDFFKIGSWLLGYLIAAKAMVKTMIIVEIIANLTLVLLSRYFVSEFGIVGVTYAFALFYAVYWLGLGILIRNTVFSTKEILPLKN